MFIKKAFFTIVVGLLLSTANAQIIYTDITPDTTRALGDPPSLISKFYPIDFNGDGVEEYNFRWDILFNGWWVHMTYVSTNEIILKGTIVGPSGARYVKPLNACTMIDSGSNWGVSTPEPLLGDNADPNIQKWLGDCYVGCKFTIENSTHYGWVRLSFDNDNTLTLRDYAYESTPDMPIKTPELVSNNDIEFDRHFSVYPSPAYHQIVIESEDVIDIDGLTIMNVSGQTLISRKETVPNQVIDVSSLASGTYIIQIDANDRKWNKMILVK